MLASLQRLRLVHLLMLMCAPPLLALVISALLGLRGMATTHASAELITVETLPALESAMQLATLMQSDAALVLRATAVYDDKDKEALLKQQAGNVSQLERALGVLKGINDADVQERLKRFGLDPMFGDVAQTTAFFKSEGEHWGKMVRTLGLSIE